MKSPAVIHFKCLDTFALQGVARSFGSGAAGVRLTNDGLAKHLRPSQRARREREDEAAKSAELDALLAREEKSDTLIPHVTEAAQVILPPPPASPRGSMASLVTIEMGLRKPTTWAVVLLTLGVSFGVGLARVASNAAGIDPVSVSAAAAPRVVAPSVAAPVRAAPAVAPSAPVPVTIALTTIVGRRHHAHGASAQAALGTSSDGVAAAPEVDNKKSDAADKGDDGDETTAAAAAAARVHTELANSL